MKVCSKCKVSLLVEMFGRSSQAKDGLNPHCKLCKAVAHKKYYEKNKIEINRKTREKYFADVEASRARSRNRDKQSERDRLNANYARNKEAILRKQKERYLANHEFIKEQKRRAASRRRARIFDREFEVYTEADVLALYGVNCNQCGDPIDLTASRRLGFGNWELGLHLDHLVAIANGGTDTLSNIRPTHAVCNARKGKRIKENKA